MTANLPCVTSLLPLLAFRRRASILCSQRTTILRPHLSFRVIMSRDISIFQAVMTRVRVMRRRENRFSSTRLLRVPQDGVA